MFGTLGYVNCACRDCFDIAITSGGPALCWDCEDAECDATGQCACERDVEPEDDDNAESFDP